MWSGLRVVGSSLMFVVVAIAFGCSSTDAAAPATPADSGAAAPTTTPPKDQKPADAAPAAEAGAPTDSGTPNTCQPKDVATFAPTWKPPSGMHQNLCNPTQIGLLADCVWSHPGRDDVACKAFFASSDTSDKNCLKCAYTPTSGAKLGAVLVTPSSVQVNYGGCIALLSGDSTANGCGAKVTAMDSCEDAACVEACPVPDGDDAAFDRFLACEKSAGEGQCKSFKDDASCGDVVLGDGGVAHECLPDTKDFAKLVTFYSELFCGAGDGG